MAGTTAAGRDDQRDKQREQRGGHEHDEQRQDEQIDRQGKDGDAVEVEGHGQGHGQFDDAGDDEQFADPKQKANRPGKDAPGDEAGQSAVSCLQRCGEHAQRDAELGEARGQLGVDGDEAQVARGC